MRLGSCFCQYFLIFFCRGKIQAFLDDPGISGEELFDQFRTFVENLSQIFQYYCAIKTVSYRAPQDYFVEFIWHYRFLTPSILTDSCTVNRTSQEQTEWKHTSDQETTVPITEDDIKKFENMVASMPDSANAHYNLGLALAQRGEWDRSLNEFRTALQFKPGLLEARVNMAGILLQKGDYDGCIDESLRALEFRPDLIEACINIGIAFMHRGMLDQAVQSFEKALAIDPDSIVAHLNLGNIFLALGEIDKSIKHNTRAVELDPASGMSHNNLSVAFYHNGDLEKARRHAQEAVKLGYKVHPDFLKQLDN